MNTEQRTIDTLTDKPIRVKVKNTGIFRHIAKHTTFHIHQPFAGTLLLMSREVVSMGLDEDKLKENPIGNTWELISQDSRKLARIIAIAMLRHRMRIVLFKGLLSRYLLWRMTPSDMEGLAQVMLTRMGMSDFLSTIRWIRGVRITAPKPLSPEDHGG
ncbi:MAG TPA: hypothetical protein P5531_04000 [Bacteroidales bacterium]|nr:hypothetical protein [Bacteroidales bacterium]